jgi:beta-galactosidase
MLYYGADYNPEQWPEPVWLEDMALMRRAGVNLVSLGVFAWARLEPREGEYRFDWLDRVMDLLHDNGIGVNLAIPTASPPPWFSLAHPDALPVNRDGVRLTHGSRDTYCVSAPAYRAASVRIATELARRYAGHPALAMWHVHNEYGTWCYCDHTAVAFRDWLRRRYRDLDALNEAWTTSFWSQGYGAWAEVLPPRATQYLPNPGQLLDYRRFLSDEMLGHFVRVRDILRGFLPGAPLTTNFAFGGWVPVDGWSWAKELDLIAIDCYPDARGRRGRQRVAFAADLARSFASAGPGRWMVMEQSADLTITAGGHLARPAGELTRHTLAHVARGARGAMFFQWRGSAGGAEMWHAAMLPHAGPRSRVFQEVCALGRTLREVADAGELADVREPADAGEPADAAEVAIVWDPESWWAMQAPGLPSPSLDYLDAVAPVHAALYRLGIACDFAPPTADLSGYRVVLVPGLYVVSDEAAANLNGYPGTLVVWYFSGIVDERVRVRPGGYPGAFRERLGVWVEQFAPQPPGVEWELSTGDTASGWRESVTLAGATAVATHPDGTPAITRYRDTWYVSTRLSDAGLTRLLAEVVAGAGVTPPEPSPGEDVEVVRRGGWLFVINHGDHPVELPAAPGRAAAPVPAGGFLMVPAS